MSDLQLELVQHLCAQAGIVMEDATLEAVSMVSENANERRARLTMLRRAACDVDALIAAAEIIDRRFED